MIFYDTDVVMFLFSFRKNSYSLNSSIDFISNKKGYLCVRYLSLSLSYQIYVYIVYYSLIAC